MKPSVMNVLFLCTGNSARSILAEAILGRWGKGKFNAYSAGSMPKGQVNPMTLEFLQQSGFDISGFRSKSWDEFSGSDAPKMDFVFTVCDNAANEVCPVWPGQPMSAHWGVEDPDRPDLTVEERRRLFAKVFREIDYRIKLFTALPLDKLEWLSLQKRLHEIGKSRPVDV